MHCYIYASDNRKKGETTVKLILIQPDENGLIDKLAKRINLKPNEKRTRTQIIAQDLTVIDLSEDLSLL